MTRNERSGWRDEALSLRHREWGHDAPGVDIDFPLIEYDKAKAVALIDYKHCLSPRVRQPSDASTRALAGLATDAGRPAFVVRYHRPHEHEPSKGWEFYVIDLNEIAKTQMPERRRMGELAFVGWLYALRGRSLPDAVRDRIKALAQAEGVSY